MNNKKGLLIVYNAHNLLEFIWYYCTTPSARELEWDALCLPGGTKGEYMSPYCEKSGIFSKIIRDDKAYSDSSLSKQIGLFAKMAWYFATGRRNSLCKKILGEYVDTDEYGTAVVLSDFGIVSGAALRVFRECVILEDGAADYEQRKNSNIFKFFFKSFSWKGFILANMGYANTAYFYPLGSTKKCVKYSSHPDRMPYKKYKEIRTLFDFSNTDKELQRTILERVYPGIGGTDLSSADTVLFTNSMSDFTKSPDGYVERIEKYFSDHSENLIIKKHPRDNTDYRFGGSVKVTEIDRTVPAEVILPYISGKKVIFM